MNLLFDPWIPVRCRSGTVRDIAPTHIADPADPPVALVAPRPDFDAALAQFLIGLLQSVLPPATDKFWREQLDEPYSPAELSEYFDDCRAAFDLLAASGPAFMQDFDRSALLAADLKPLDALLIESPGANTVENNADLFIKRDRIGVLCPPIAAMALLSLQINAPAGGAGHRTGLRGGGPLTTLIWPRGGAGLPETTLWQKLWFNVMPSEPLRDEQRGAGWPWLVATRESRNNVKVQHGPLALRYFACPRRIRLHVEPSAGRTCDLSGRAAEHLITGWHTLNYGADYPSDRFRHPLSPYYRPKPDSPELLPLHPRQGGFCYRDFQQLAASSGESQELAEVVQLAKSTVRASALETLGDSMPLWANGFDMDNMKARAWHEARFPVFPDVPGERGKELSARIRQWTAAASAGREVLGRALREAWSPQAEGNTSAAEAQFWSSTEAGFYAGLRASTSLNPLVEADSSALHALAEQWRSSLRKAVLQLFGQYAERGNRQLDGLERAAKARKKLLSQFHVQVSKALDLPVTNSKPTQEAA